MFQVSERRTDDALPRRADIDRTRMQHIPATGACVVAWLRAVIIGVQADGSSPTTKPPGAYFSANALRQRFLTDVLSPRRAWLIWARLGRALSN